MNRSKIHIIYPHDPTTEFLLEIPKYLSETYGESSTNLIPVHPTDESYLEQIKNIANIPINSIVLFMGHGQNDILYGAESESFTKRPLLKKNDLKIFEGRYLFTLACNSNELLKSTFNHSKIINSIGFGSLPTGMVEVLNNKKLKDKGINENIIKRYKDILVELVSFSFGHLIEKQCTFSDLSNYFGLVLTKKISSVILEDKKSIDNRILANLLFQMKSEMVFI